MTDNAKKIADQGRVTRRNFLLAGGAAVAGSALAMSCGKQDGSLNLESAAEGNVRRLRILGRTGFKVSDISMGCGSISDANVVRYAYDKGVNYFDVAESYGNGDSETKIGEAMQFMDRSKIFITTKVVVGEEDTVDTLVDRFTQCLSRMQTDYADCLFMHSITDVNMVENAPFHAAIERLKGDGRVRFAGISSHGPRGAEGDSMDSVLCKAAEDGRFDVMLLTYNFMNTEEGDRVLAACKKNKVGTTAMKVCPGYLEVERWDPDNRTTDYQDYIDRMSERGVAEEESITRIVNWIARMDSVSGTMKPFTDKHGLTTQDQLQKASTQWVLRNPDMHTVCVSMPDFDSLDNMVPLSGTELSAAGSEFLDEFRYANNHRYCRHACTACAGSCPEALPVSTIMRYSYYFQRQGREKHAMLKYAALGGKGAEACSACKAPCSGACPHGVNIQSNLVRAHSLMSLPEAVG
ncbi:MAG: hypothetical protein GY835_17025 [bacterium]|nr:hypothetical protein [bacterium]